MKKKFVIRIERREFYNFDVEVEAGSPAEAVRNVEDRFAAGEFDNEKELFCSPYDTEDRVYCAEEKEFKEDEEV